MHAILQAIGAILELLSFPFPTWRKKGEGRSQMEEMQNTVLLVSFGALALFGAVILVADILTGR